MSGHISKTTSVFMLAVAILIDIVQFFVGFLDVIFIGTPINWGINVFAGLGFYIWFKINGVSFNTSKRMVTLGGSILFKLIPILNMLPAWTFLVVRTVGSTKISEAVPGAGAATKIGGVSGRK